MTVDQKPELPHGYIWKEIPSIGARIAMPDTWFYRDLSAVSLPGPRITNAYFLTRESINSSIPVIKSEGNTAIVTSEPEGYFKTGLSVDVVPRFGRGMQIADMRHRIMNNPDSVPMSAVVSTEEGPLRTSRRFVKSRPRRVLGLDAPEINLYIEFTHNTRTGTVYILTFETPPEMWESDKEIAKTMMESRVLNPEV